MIRNKFFFEFLIVLLLQIFCCVVQAEHPSQYQCSQCTEPGTYCFENQKFSCPSNSRASADAYQLSDCICNNGFKQRVDDPGHNCDQCTNGEYCFDENVYLCSSISDFMTSAVESQTQSDCVCVEGYTWDGSACVECIAGTYKDFKGTGACTLCAANTFNTNTGQISNTCQGCPLNTVSEAGSDNIMDCVSDVGHYGNPGEEATPCEEGTFQEFTDKTFCSDCIEGASSGQGGTLFRRRLLVAPLASPITNHGESIYYSSITAASSFSDCSSCPAFSRVPGGSSGVSISDCLCQEGYFGVPADGCERCPVGTFKNTLGSEICNDCPENTFNVYEASTDISYCIGCPSDSTTLALTGISKKSKCHCNAGFEKNTAQDCVACPNGEISSGGVVSTCVKCAVGSYDYNNICEACPEFSTTMNDGSYSINSCVCMPGYYPAGVSCLPCLKGSYKVETSNSSCTLCQVDQFTDSDAQTSFKTCPIKSTNIATLSGVGSDSILHCVCEDGYHAVSSDSFNTFTCEACALDQISIDNIIPLSIQYNEKICETCALGEYPVNNVCNSCASNHANTNADSAVESELYCVCDPGYQCNSLQFHTQSPSGSEDGKTYFITDTPVQVPLYTEFTVNWGLTNSHPWDISTHEIDLVSPATDEVEIQIDYTQKITTVKINKAQTLYARCGIASHKFKGVLILFETCNCVACEFNEIKPELSNTALCTDCQTGHITSPTDEICIACEISKYADALQNLCIDCGVLETTESSESFQSSDCICKTGHEKIGNDCQTCPFNTYKDAIGNSPCQSCEYGKIIDFKASNSSSDCNICDDFYYYRHSNSIESRECISCSQDADGNRLTDELCRCLPGYTGDGRFSCVLCEIGMYKETTSDEECLSCPVGKSTDAFVASVAVNSCLDCAAGKYESGRVCEDCSLYSQSVAGSSECLCNPGYQRFQGIYQFPCVQCETGKYKSDVTEELCSDCLNFTYANVTGMTACHVCPEGKEQFHNSLRININSCVCKPGTYTSGQDCVDCEEGKYNTIYDEYSCTSCTQNQYMSQFGTGLEHNYCEACPLNSVSSSSNAMTCVCNSGYFANTPSSPHLGCSACSSGSYVNSNLQCELCPDHSTSEELSVGISSCICNAGKFFNSTKNLCETCPVNSHCSNNVIIPCAENRNTRGLNGRSLESDCLCIAGYYGASCEECEDDSWCDNSIAYGCPLNSFSASKATSIDDCFCNVNFKKVDNVCQQCSNDEICGAAKFNIETMVTTSLDDVENTLSIVSSVVLQNVSSALKFTKSKINIDTKVETSRMLITTDMQSKFESTSSNFDSDFETSSTSFLNITLALISSNLGTAKNDIISKLDSYFGVNSNSQFNPFNVEMISEQLSSNLIRRRLLTTNFEFEVSANLMEISNQITEAMMYVESDLEETFSSSSNIEITKSETNTNIEFTQSTASTGMAVTSNAVQNLKSQLKDQIARSTLKQTTDIVFEGSVETDVIFESGVQIEPASAIQSQSASGAKSSIAITGSSVVASAALVCSAPRFIDEAMCICPIGTFCSSVQAGVGCPASSTCEDCPTEKICQNNVQEDCPSNKEPNAANTECICREGYIDIGQHGCVECGTSTSVVVVDSISILNLEGSYCPRDADTETTQQLQCSSLDPNSLHSKKSSRSLSDCLCDAGYFKLSDNDLCKPCPKNFFCPGPLDEEDSFINPNVFACHENAITLNLGSTDITSCYCTVGFSVDAENPEILQCLLCEDNFLCRGQQDSVRAECIGNKVSNSDHSSCICDVGYELEADVCNLCDSGKYKTEPGNENCISCGPGSFTSLIPESLIQQCQACPTGKTSYQSENTVCVCEAPKIDDGSASCIHCPVDQYYSLIDRTCHSCLDSDGFKVSPGNQIDDATENFGLMFCECKDGYIRNFDTYFCEACTEGTFAIDNECKTCGANSESLANSDNENDCTCTETEARKLFDFDGIDIPDCVYTPQTNNKVCTACVAGKFKSSLGDDCHDGSTGSTPTQCCENCAIGEYQSSTGQSHCDECGPDENTVAQASTLQTDCLCNAGYTENDRQTGNACIECDNGKYKTELSNNDCTECEIGKFQPHHGQIDCDDCNYHPVYGTLRSQTTAETGSTSDQDCVCTTGYYDPVWDDEIMPLNCQFCSHGTFKDFIGTETCTFCGSSEHAHTYSDPANDVPYVENICDECPSNSGQDPTLIDANVYSDVEPIKLKSDFVTMRAISDCVCHPGHYKNDANSGACEECVSGDFTFKLEYGNEACQVCADNHYWQGIDSSCGACTLNDGVGNKHVNVKFSDRLIDPIGYATSEAECQCNLGYERQANNICYECQAGKYKSNFFQSSCLDCPINEYQTANGKISCIRCQDDSSTISEVGRTAQNDCVCNAGFENDASNDCQPCTAGKFKAAPTLITDRLCQDCSNGKYSENNAEICTECGTDQDSETRNDKKTCICKEGYGSAVIDAPVDADWPIVCTICPVGFYSEEQQYLIEGVTYKRMNCVQCPDHMTTVLDGQDSREDCVCQPGAEPVDISKPAIELTCQQCVDSFRDTKESIECTDCPFGAITDVDYPRLIDNCMCDASNGYVVNI